MSVFRKGKKAQATGKIRVEATAEGVYGHRREAGAQFHIEDEAHFHPSWMQHVDEEGKAVEDSPVLKAHKKRENERVLKAQQQLQDQQKLGGTVTLPYPDDEDGSDEKGSQGADDLGVYQDGVLQQELTTGSPIVQPGAVGHPGQDDKNRPQPFDARHDIQQDTSKPHQLKDGTAKLPEMDEKKGTRAADKKVI